MPEILLSLLLGLSSPQAAPSAPAPLEPRYIDHLGGSAPAPTAAAAEQFLSTVRRIEERNEVQVRLVNHGFSGSQF